MDCAQRGRAGRRTNAKCQPEIWGVTPALAHRVIKGSTRREREPALGGAPVHPNRPWVSGMAGAVLGSGQPTLQLSEAVFSTWLRSLPDQVRLPIPLVLA